MTTTTMQRYSLALLLTTLAAPQLTQPTATVSAFFYTDTGQLNLARVAGCACLASLVGAGVYALYDYDHLSDQELITDTRQLLLQAERYQPLLQIVVAAPTPRLATIAEPTLAQLTDLIGTVSIRQYLDELERLQRYLNANVVELEQRRQKLMRKVLRRPDDSMTQAEHQIMIDVMSALERTAQPVQQQLYVLQRYLSEYFGYFALAQIHTELRKKYATVLKAAQTPDAYQFKRTVRQLVTDQTAAYPLLQAAQTIQADLENLAETAHRFGYEPAYPAIMRPICELQQSLEQVHSLILADSEYAAEHHRHYLVSPNRALPRYQAAYRPLRPRA